MSVPKTATARALFCRNPRASCCPLLYLSPRFLFAKTRHFIHSSYFHSFRPLEAHKKSHRNKLNFTNFWSECCRMFGRYADKFRLQLFNTTLFALWTCYCYQRDVKVGHLETPTDAASVAHLPTILVEQSSWNWLACAVNEQVFSLETGETCVVTWGPSGQSLVFYGHFLCLIIYAIARINFLNWRKKARRGATRNEEIRTSSVILRITFFCGSDNLWTSTVTTKA